MAVSTNVASFTPTRGDTFVQRITVKETDGTAHDLTGATVRYTVRESTFDGTQILQKTVGAGIQLTAPASGILDVTLDAADTVGLTPGLRYTYDCEVTIAGEVQTVQFGYLTFAGDVSV